MAPLLALLAAAEPANDSVYTTLDLDRCTILEHVPEEEDYTRWRCEGHATIPLFVHYGDARFDIDAGLDNEDWGYFGSFNQPGPRVEWRMRGREAIAIIYRLSFASPEAGPGSVLIVKTVGRGDRPGCRIATIEGTLPDANARARAAADRAPGFRCGVDQPEGQ